MSERPADAPPGEDWAGEMGDRWLKHLDRFEGMIAPVGEALISRADFRRGERVVDIGCGAGGTSVEIAQRVGPQGCVLGIDLSPQLVQAAERRARAAQVSNAEFRCADAALVSVDGARFDRLFSRFGVMFFADTAAAFANLHSLLGAGGRMDFGAWAPARENLWIAQVLKIIRQYIEVPQAVPRTPGPFALDDPDYIRELLTGAGFTSIHIETWRGEQMVAGRGASARQATDFVLDAMSIGKILEESASEVRDAVTAQLLELFTRHQDAEGVRMAAAAFLVTAAA